MVPEPPRSKWKDPKYSRSVRNQRALLNKAGGDQTLLTLTIEVEPAVVDLVVQNAALRRQLAVFADEANGADRELRGASNFLKALVHMADRNADTSKFGWRCVAVILSFKACEAPGG